MYSPFLMEDCYKYINVKRKTYSADPGVSVDLECHQESGTVEEEEVSLPISWVVMSLGIDCPWYWP